MMFTLLSLLGVNSMPDVVNPSSFLGLGKAGLITTIIISVILITTVVWLINGTKKRD